MAQASWASDTKKPVCRGCGGTGQVYQTLGRYYFCGCQTAKQFVEDLKKIESEQDFLAYLNEEAA